MASAGGEDAGQVSDAPSDGEHAVLMPAAEASWLWRSATNGFRFLADGSDGAPDIYEELGGRGDGPPLHRHPWASWELVLEGRVRMVAGGETYVLGPGDALHIPSGVPHAYIVESETARLVGVSLSGGRFPDLQRVAGPLLTAPGGPDREAMARNAAAHDAELLGPPLTLDEPN
ncbi:MAG: cupin domain-containing protein [Acidimicrobiia bacterium]|nr:cupin domain-containing protein [Acidimicrobiia bacterium]